MPRIFFPGEAAARSRLARRPAGASVVRTARGASKWERKRAGQVDLKGEMLAASSAAASRMSPRIPVIRLCRLAIGRNDAGLAC